MTALWTAAEAAAATGGQATGDWAATGVSIDSRTLRPGDLFVALADARDGHDFVADALARGAAAAMVSRHPEGVAADAPLLRVGDVLDGLTALGRAGRARSSARVVAVTGSAGKTSTKEMLRTILGAQGKAHAAEASYNNHWGVPLTLARLPRAADFAVIEIGMNHPGEIAPLARLARPHVALVTTVAAAHLAAFDGLAAIAREKAAVFQGLEPGGIAIVNADLETAPILETGAAGATLQRFGAAEAADWRLIGTAREGGVTVVRAAHAGRRFVFKIAAPGAHFAMNGLAALAAADALGADLALAAAALGRWAPPAGRGTVERLALDPADPGPAVDLIDDAFNANPASMAAALEVLADTVPRGAGRRIAILGDMLELGPAETALHVDLAGHPAMERVAAVHCVGPRMAALWDALPEHRRGEKTEMAEDLAARFYSLIAPGDVVLVKGSKGSRVSLVAAALRRLAAAETLGAEG